MRWLALTTKTLMGIDISARYIRLIVLAKNQNNESPQIQHFAMAELPMMVLTESNDIKDHATISSTLIQLKTSGQIATNTVAIALPGSAVVTKQIFLANEQNELQLEEQVWLEAAKHFPDLIEDLSLDFYSNGPAEHDAKLLDILLVACRTTSIEKRLSVLQDSHLQVQVVDVDYYALERSLGYMLQHLPEFKAENTYALLHFSTRSSTLIVVQNKLLRYAHDQSFDSQQLLQALQQQLQWPNIINQSTQLPTHLPEEAHSLVNETCIDHIQHVLQLFYTSKQECTIDHLFIAGDCALIPEIAAMIEAQTNLTTSIANPLINMSFHANVDQLALQTHAPLLCLCTGLALHVSNHDHH